MEQLASGAADAVFPDAALMAHIGEADVVALTCPLTPQTERLINAAALAFATGELTSSTDFATATPR